MTLEIAGQILESVMLVAFGLSWPISILKSYRLKFVRGKSVWFLILIVIGYAAGTLAKIFRCVDAHKPLEFTVWLYIINGLLVCVDLGLYFRYRHNHEPVTKEVAEDIAKIIEKDIKSEAEKS